MRLPSGAAGLVLGALILVACSNAAPELPKDVVVVAQEQTSSWVRNFNPLTPTGAARWPTRAGVYEPMVIYNAAQERWVPWLATAWAWSDDARTVRFTLREDVKWSDGRPFSADDVAFTFHYLKAHKGLDAEGLWGFLDSVKVLAAHQIAFHFSRTYTPGFASLSQQAIVPAHLWSKVDDPITFANPNPVGTGPFTEVRLFQNQVFELGRNPHYWQAGRPAVEALRFPALPNNDAANLALVRGELDWAGNFVPVIERTYVARDPEHFGYWFPPADMILLYPNTKRAPFDDVRVRKAISMSINRQLMVNVAQFGYSEPAHVSGLSPSYASWRTDLNEGQEDWARHAPDRAAELLDEAGWVLGDDGVRRGADGQPASFEILVVTGWSDWVRAAQVISQNLRAAGIDARVRTYDFGAWFDRIQRGDFDLSVSWSLQGATPYRFYRWMMSPKTVKPLGEISAGNWHRFGLPAADPILTRFEATTERDDQQRLISDLQALFIGHAPAIPLFPNPSWGLYNTRRIVGFPTAADPFARLSPNHIPECLLVMTALRTR